MIATTREFGCVGNRGVALAPANERLVVESPRPALAVQAFSDAVIAVDRSGRVLLVNEGGSKLATLANATLANATGERSLVHLLGALGFADVACEGVARLWSDGEAIRLCSHFTGHEAEPLVEVAVTPTRDADGQVAGAVLVMRDITDIARIERERVKTARLESLGVIGGGLAHDFNNILMGIVGNLSLAQALAGPEEGALGARLSRALSACARARGVANQFLTFARGGAPVKTITSIGELVTKSTLFALSGSSVAPRFVVPDDLWAADVDPVQIEQVVHNLVLNAKQASPQGGSVDVVLGNVDLGADELSSRAPLASGRYVCITIQDRGLGISAEHLHRIFEPYFTTREKGRGLGLAIAYSIVRAHGGAIVVNSCPGEGARFTVYLPSAVGRTTAMTARRCPAVTRSHPVTSSDCDVAVAGSPSHLLDS